MTKLFKKAALSSAVAAALLASGTAMAEVEFNVSATSNYLWRGMTQTEDGAAIQGGIDYAHESGFYVGSWTSNVKFGDDSGYELDGYFGFAKEIGDVGFDVGYIYYAYPTFDDSDFGEIYLNASWKFLNGGLAYVVNTQDAVEGMENALYYYIGASFDIPAGLTLGGTIGHMKFDDSADDFTHFQLSLGKSTDFGDFMLALDKNDIDGDDDPRVSVSWAKTF